MLTGCGMGAFSLLTVTEYVDHPGVLPYSLGGDVLLGLRKSYPLLDQIFQILRP